MLFHLGVVLLLALVCILFGLLRADLKEDDDEKACGNCQDHDSCDHFTFVGAVSPCESHQAVNSDPQQPASNGSKPDCQIS